MFARSMDLLDLVTEEDPFRDGGAVEVHALWTQGLMGGRSSQPLSRGIVRALADVAKVVARHRGQAAVIGGIGVIARGVQRLTRDIDIAVAIDAADNATLAAELQSFGIVPRISDAVAFTEESQVLLMRHSASSVDIDVSRAWLPFELEALSAATPATLGGVVVATALAEDLVSFQGDRLASAGPARRGALPSVAR